MIDKMPKRRKKKKLGRRRNQKCRAKRPTAGIHTHSSFGRPDQLSDCGSKSDSEFVGVCFLNIAWVSQIASAWARSIENCKDSGALWNFINFSGQSAVRRLFGVGLHCIYRLERHPYNCMSLSISSEFRVIFLCKYSKLAFNRVFVGAIK